MGWEAPRVTIPAGERSRGPRAQDLTLLAVLCGNRSLERHRPSSSIFACRRSQPRALNQLARVRVRGAGEKAEQLALTAVRVEHQLVHQP